MTKAKRLRKYGKKSFEEASETDAVWFANSFEDTGYFTSEGRMRPKAVIKQLNQEIMDKWEGNQPPNSRTLELYKRPELFSFLKLVLPHLNSPKKEQAILAMEAIENNEAKEAGWENRSIELIKEIEKLEYNRKDN